MASSTQPLSTALSAEVAAAEWTLPPATPRLVALGRLARRNPVGVIALIIVACFIFLGIFGPMITPYDPRDTDASAKYLGPSLEHPFGTNALGEDIFSRIFAGARISFQIGLVAVFLGFFPGALLGIISGYYQRWIDYIIQRSGEAWAAFPVLILYLAFITAIGRGLHTIAIVVALAGVFGGSRVLRAAAIVVKQNDYVEASRSLGATNVHILFKHIIPNVMPIVIVGASSIFAVSVLGEAALSFLGLGVEPSTPSWGIDMSDAHAPNLRNARYYPHLVIFPGMAISLVVLAFNLLGDTLRDILDPRLRGTT